jgi:ABC-type Fe3+-hydroxamate transport system substrate-binding protein
MPTFIDQLGNRITLDSRPTRIISVVPSQSEFLWDIGLKEELVGITKFCIHPAEMFSRVERVGGTKKIDIEKIRALQPDLIIGNKEENEKSQIELLQQDFNVWMSDIYNFNDALDMMEKIGDILDRKEETKKITGQIQSALPGIKNIFNHEKVAYFIWKDPYMLAGSNTYIDHVLQYTGLNNVAASLSRYPEIDNEKLKALSPEYCFLSSEPYPFKEKHIQEIEALLRSTNAMIVDGELFSWYGSRLQQLPAYIKDLKQKIMA